jgi:hypothetical protein
VLYLGRIPHGFYEDEMKAYFEQFGDVSRLRLARNKKVGEACYCSKLVSCSDIPAANRPVLLNTLPTSRCQARRLQRSLLRP